MNERACRFHQRPDELLRQPDGAVRQARVPRLRRPVDVRVLGRHAPDGGGLQGDRRRGAARAVRVPGPSRRDLLRIEADFSLSPAPDGPLILARSIVT